MAKTNDYINCLKEDKKTLVETLTSMGKEASEDETFTELIPKISSEMLEIKDADYLFYQNSRLDNLNELLPITKAKNLKNMFASSTKINNLDLTKLDLSIADNVTNMFSSCSNLKEIKFGTCDSNSIYYTSSMFSNCTKLESVNIEDVAINKVRYMDNMFYNCTKLKSINLKNLTPITSIDCSIDYMFNKCESLVSIDIGHFNLSNTTFGIANVFKGCKSLTNLVFGTEFGKKFIIKSEFDSRCTVSLKDSPNLTHDSLMDVINKLYDLNLTYDVANGGTLYRQKLEIGEANIAKLTEEEKAIATAKGWEFY